MILWALLVALPGTVAAQSRPAVDAVIESIEKVHGFAETAVSPDGRRVAWVEDLTPSGDEGPTAIWVKELPSGKPIRISAVASGTTQSHEAGLAWSPDSRMLAFVSDPASHGQRQIFVTDMSSRPRKVTAAKGQLDHPRWSPDGKQIAFLYVAGSTQAAGALVAYKPDSGVVGDNARRAADCDRGRRVGSNQGAQSREHVGLRLRLVARRKVVRRRSDGGIRHQQLLDRPALHRRRGERRRPNRSGNRGSSSPFRGVSPDGEWIAVIHGIMSDEGANGGDVYLVPSRGGAAKNITPNTNGPRVLSSGSRLRTCWSMSAPTAT